MSSKRKFLVPALHWSESPANRVLGPMQEFIHKSASSGIVLMISTVLALLIANSPLSTGYEELLHTYVGVSFGAYQIKLSLLHWINHGLMAIFLFLLRL